MRIIKVPEVRTQRQGNVNRFQLSHQPTPHPKISRPGEEELRSREHLGVCVRALLTENFTQLHLFFLPFSFSLWVQNSDLQYHPRVTCVSFSSLLHQCYSLQCTYRHGRCPDNVWQLHCLTESSHLTQQLRRVSSPLPNHWKTKTRTKWGRSATDLCHGGITWTRMEGLTSATSWTRAVKMTDWTSCISDQGKVGRSMKS